MQMERCNKQEKWYTSNSDEDGICQRMQWCMHNHTCIGSDLVLQISRHIGQNISCLFLHPNKLHVNFDGSAKNQGLRDHCYTLLPFISIYVIPLPLSKSDPALGGSKRQPGQGPQNIDGIERWCANIGLPIYWTKRKQLLGAPSRNRMTSHRMASISLERTLVACIFGNMKLNLGSASG